MKFEIENLGKIDKASIEVKDLTIICGPNSASKTWLSYSIYHYLNTLKSMVNNTGYVHGLKSIYQINEFPAKVDINSDSFKNYLSKLVLELFNIHSQKLHLTFNSHPELFSDTKITSDLIPCYVNSITDHIKNNSGRIQFINNILLSKSEKSNVFSFSKTQNNEDFSIVDEDEDLFDIYDIKTTFNVLLKHYIIDIIHKVETKNKPFVITSERVGSVVFQKDIDGTALSIKEKLESLLEQNNDPSIQGIVRDLHQLTIGNRASLATPVRKNLLAVRNAESELKKVSDLKNEHPYIASALQDIVKGKFEVEGGTLVFTANDNSHQLPITITSSSIKSLFLIDLYINSLAKKDDILLIDEPELNLHPDNQRLMAKVIVRIVNAGIKVLMTTHSDYLIREVNNAVMMSTDFPERSHIMEENNLIVQDIISQDKVSAYAVNENGKVSKMPISDTGIDTLIFDELISKANNLQDSIYDGLEDQ